MIISELFSPGTPSSLTGLKSAPTLMAAKRFLDQSGSDPDQPEEKRFRTSVSFSTGIREAMMVKSFQGLCSALEPLLRRVVQEEVERSVTRAAHTLYRSPSLKIQAVEPSSTLQLIFTKSLLLPIFTGSKIEDEANNPLQINLVDTASGGRSPAPALSSPIKVEIVVLDGDFPGNDREDWTSEEFNNKIVKEREGKRPLLTGDMIVNLRDGFAAIGEIEFTDNSSWIRSRNFRLGARVAPGTSQRARIKEAITEPFAVKDHRGELYRKHYPPSLKDEVWRLERIGKDGAFHRRLTDQGILTVQHFLKLWVISAHTLRRILGMGMSDKMWEGTMKHATTCIMGNKLYLYKAPRSVLLLNPICQVMGAIFNGQVYTSQALVGQHKAHVERLAVDAYKHWETLEEVDGILGLDALLQSDLMAQGGNAKSVQMDQQIEGHDIVGGHHELAPLLTSNSNMEFIQWHQIPTSFPAAAEETHLYISDSASDDDSNPSLLPPFFPVS